MTTANAHADPTQMANAIRALAMDAVQEANSGHPGMPMGMADIAVALWARHLKHDPAAPGWIDRDRFVLSNGHGSMLLYALLHLTGYALSADDLRAFRKLHSKTPGHPEVDVTPGVETTTGPLGQGLANAVGMALAEKLLAAEFNRPGLPVVDHFTWVFAGDGCLMEGISHECCSLAGTLQLSKLVVLYDDNGISIDGEVSHWFGDDSANRFRSYGWNVIGDIDGHDADAVDQALHLARRWGTEGNDGRFAPTLIQCKTRIGRGSPNRENTAKAHGEALGAAEVAATRSAIGWPHAPFDVPQDVRAMWDAREAGGQAHRGWRETMDRYREAFPKEAAELERRMAGRLPGDWPKIREALLADAAKRTDAIATRKASQNALNVLGPAVPELLGGSADLTGSNLTDWKGVHPVRAAGLQPVGSHQAEGGPSFERGRHINWGVREFGMSAALNGMALHGGFIPFGGTFLTFSDYARNALRMAALMKRRVIFVYTHDSIGLGEDGPTHQSVEHAASLRIMPNMDVWRPCDSMESAVAWACAIERADGPSSLLFSRQALAVVAPTSDAAAAKQRVDEVARGGYVLLDAEGGAPDAVLIATGSEVALAAAARDRLAAEGLRVRLVSMPSTTVFDRQDAAWRAQVLPHGVPRVAVEAGITDFWWKYRVDAVVGLDRYGESAPAPDLFAHFGLTPERVAAVVHAAVGR